MLVIAVENVLQFIDIKREKPFCTNHFEVDSDIIDFSISWNDKYLFCLQQEHPPALLNIRKLKDIKVADTIQALDGIVAGKFRKKKRVSLVVGTDLSIVGIYNVSHKSIAKVRTVPGPVVALDINPDDDRVAVACRTGQIVILEFSDLEEIYVFEDIAYPMRSLQFHPVLHSIFAVHDAEGVLTVFDLENPDCVMPKKFAGGIKTFGFIPAKTLVVTLGDCHKCSIYSIEDEKFLFHHNLCDDPISVAFTGHHFVLGMDDGSIALFDVFHYMSPWKLIQCADENIRSLKFFNQFKFADNPNEHYYSLIPPNYPAEDLNFSYDPDAAHRNKQNAKDRPPNVLATDNRIVFKECPDEMLLHIKQEFIEKVNQNVGDLERSMMKQLEQYRSVISHEFFKMHAIGDAIWDNLMKQVCVRLGVSAKEEEEESAIEVATEGEVEQIVLT